MTTEQPEPLWREVVGDTEPWRRGRLFLALLAIWTFASHLLLIGSQILVGRLDVLLAAAIGALVWWLLFYFIWIGVHWVRWLSAGLSGLTAFANLIWGIVYGNPVRLVDGLIALPLAAYLGLAPSVYFFAKRQKETVRWKESLIVGAVVRAAAAQLRRWSRHSRYLQDPAGIPRPRLCRSRVPAGVC